MKFKMMTAVVCLGAFAGLSAQAQVMDTVKVKLPVETTVNGVVLPAGAYTIRDLKDDGGASILQISSDSNKRLTTLVTAMQVAGTENNKTSVLLHHGVKGYAIEKINIEGESFGFELINAGE